LAERESIYRLLGQTTPDNLNKEWKSYTLDPVTRYPNLNRNVVVPLQTTGLFDTDDPTSLERMRRNSIDVEPVEMPKKRRRGELRRTGRFDSTAMLQETWTTKCCSTGSPNKYANTTISPSRISLPCSRTGRCCAPF
jgi:hypothetical protein